MDSFPQMPIMREKERDKMKTAIAVLKSGEITPLTQSLIDYPLKSASTGW